MANSIHGPQRRPEGPYVAHLEKVCRLLDSFEEPRRGPRTGFTVEFHPYGDLPGNLRGQVIRGVRLHIMDGGDVSFMLSGSDTGFFVGLRLSNYGSLWRVWIGGMPGEAARREKRWRP